MTDLKDAVKRIKTEWESTKRTDLMNCYLLNQASQIVDSVLAKAESNRRRCVFLTNRRRWRRWEPVCQMKITLRTGLLSSPKSQRSRWSFVRSSGFASSSSQYFDALIFQNLTPFIVYRVRKRGKIKDDKALNELMNIIWMIVVNIKWTYEYMPFPEFMTYE